MKKYLYFLLTVIVLLGCSDNTNKVTESQTEDSTKQVIYSQIKPTEKFPAGSIWQIKYDEGVLEIPMQYLGQRSIDGFLDVFFSWPDIKPGVPDFYNEGRVRILMRIKRDNPYKEVVSEVVEKKISMGNIEKKGGSKDYSGLVRYEHQTGWFFVVEDKNFLTPKENYYVISCINGMKRELNNVILNMCSYQIDYGDGVSIKVRFYENALYEWKTFLKDINQLMESFRRIA